MKDKNNHTDQPSDETKPPDETQPKYREISKAKLDQVIENHKKWLDTDGKEGSRADLPDVDLSGQIFLDIDLSQAFFDRSNLRNTDFSGCTLQKTIFTDAKLQSVNFSDSKLHGASFDGANISNGKFIKAKLKKTIFRSAILENANLSGAELNGANLTNANMRSTILEGVKGLDQATLHYTNMDAATGLLGNEFAQADLTGTTLPKNYLEFNPLETVKETSQNARKIFFALLLGCVYSWLTIATTSDVNLLTNTASSPLPIIGTEIPIAWFYIVAPLILISLYLYFHLYLQGLWESLASLPAIFPDGKRLDERAYPWLLNRLVRRHFNRLKNSRPINAHEQEFVVIALAWWVVPITMVGFWLRYIPRHDWFGTILHLGLFVVSMALAITYYGLCSYTLKGGKELRLSYWKNRSAKSICYGIIIIGIGIIFSLLSYGAIEGIRSSNPELKNIKMLVPFAFNKMSYDVFADFREKSVSEKPDNYGLIAKEERFEFVKGAILKKANLTYADMYDAFLVKADLRGAILNGANLGEANLHQADLEEANLQQANLQRVNLQQAKLSKANLQQADLWGGTSLLHAILESANLYQVDLVDANLQGADLTRANLEKAYLLGANLQKANLEKANLQQTDLVDTNLQQARLVDTNLKEANLYEANLQQANLWGAMLQQANFTSVNLQQANLERADLQDADMRLADLIGAKNLTIKQLSKVKTLYKAKLDPELLEQVIKCCPHLFEEPKEETDEKE